MSVRKLYCIFSRDALNAMNGVRGKMMAQAGHAFLHAFWDAADRFPDDAKAYKTGSAFKITLVVPGEKELQILHDAYQPIAGVALITDAARTVLKAPMVTCLGIGPLGEAARGTDLRELPALK